VEAGSLRVPCKQGRKLLREVALDVDGDRSPSTGSGDVIVSRDFLRPRARGMITHRLRTTPCAECGNGGWHVSREVGTDGP
jgi:hypothetical protein